MKRELAGDLDWITMRALEKDRERRYASPSEFAADVARFLNNEPVVARPASAAYQLRKLVARHKAPFAVAGLLFVLISAFGVWMSLLYAEAEQLRREAVDAKTAEQEQRELAEKTAGELRQVSDFQADMLAQIDPADAGVELTDGRAGQVRRCAGRSRRTRVRAGEAGGGIQRHWSRVNATDAARELIDRTILEPAIRTIDERFHDQPLVDAQLRQTLANRYRELGLYEAALPLQTSALDTRRRILGDDRSGDAGLHQPHGAPARGPEQARQASLYYRESLDTRAARSATTIRTR